ncbi:alpha/beta hydrolase [Salinivibrio sp. ES.052]|uniref:alpha/beta hydrolase n=1 Tax=Salinivibrio sp. ES.052 TaxID=1882823 RepID=UPI000925E0F0|nr:alpha/beta fold hydrolase [Salinivibrio sp. ES.052]SIO32079.1 Serine aminopeptidase, S33 [Salinivibrio sp. ES.052]
MSRKVYFSTPGRFSAKRTLVGVISRCHHRLAPSHAKTVARKLFLTPTRSPAVNSAPEGLVRFKAQSQQGELQMYSVGAGPTWLLTHGWSGSASQFFPLMTHIASLGFRAVAFDHPAHGESGGQQSHIPGFVQAINDVLDQVDNVSGVVAHSMGAAAVLESEHPQLDDLPLFLVAPVLNYRENLYATVQQSGYSLKLFDEIVQEVGDQHGYPIETIEPLEKLGLRRQPVVIAHDRQDRFASFSVTEKANDYQHVRLLPTEGLGHGRILKSEVALQAFSDLAAKMNPAVYSVDNATENSSVSTC